MLVGEINEVGVINVQRYKNEDNANNFSNREDYKFIRARLLVVLRRVADSTR